MAYLNHHATNVIPTSMSAIVVQKIQVGLPVFGSSISVSLDGREEMFLGVNLGHLSMDCSVAEGDADKRGLL